MGITLPDTVDAGNGDFAADRASSTRNRKLPISVPELALTSFPRLPTAPTRCAMAAGSQEESPAKN